jgi:hypothetical protein
VIIIRKKQEGKEDHILDSTMGGISDILKREIVVKSLPYDITVDVI